MRGIQIVRKIRDISEDEMIAVFLQTELNSTRFRQDIEAYARQERIDPRMLHVPDWRDARENALRRAVLGVYRGYGSREFLNSKSPDNGFRSA